MACNATLAALEKDVHQWERAWQLFQEALEAGTLAKTSFGGWLSNASSTDSRVSYGTARVSGAVSRVCLYTRRSSNPPVLRSK